MCLSFFRSVGDPVKDSLEHSSLLAHIEVVSFKDVTEFLHSEILKLFTGNNLLKVIENKLVGLSLQLKAGEECELPDADAVLWAELLPQEVAAGSYYVFYVELIGCYQQLLHIVLCHRERAGVCKLDDDLHHVRRQARDVVDLFIWG